MKTNLMDWIEKNLNSIINLAIILAVSTLLYFLIGWIYKRVTRHAEEKYDYHFPEKLKLVKTILRIMLVVITIITIGFIFLNKNYYNVLKENFERVLYVGIVASVTIIFATIVNQLFKRSTAKKLLENEDVTTQKFFRYIVVVSIYFIGVMLCIMAFPSLRNVAKTALGGAGVLAIIAGVASQEALANFIGGIFIISFKPFKVGDVIKLDNTMSGTVTDITLRHTVLRNFENKRIVIPNAIINKEKLTNYDLDDTKCCEHIHIDISYDSNIDLAKEILREECENHPFIIDNRSYLEVQKGFPIVKVKVVGLEDSSVMLRAWAWCENFGNAFALKCDVYESVKKRYDKEGIEIPFPYRTIVMKNTDLS